MNRLLRSLAASAMLAGFVPTFAQASFLDVPSTHPYATYISSLEKQGVVSGQNGYYRPNDALTRAELTKIVLLAAKKTLDSAGTATFPDVQSNHSLYAYVETAARTGVVSGYPDGMFRPDRFVTRGEATKIVARTFGLPANLAGAPRFTDVPAGSSFYTYVESLVNAGAITGITSTTFGVDTFITRGEMAKLTVVTQTKMMGDQTPAPTPTTPSIIGLTTDETTECILDRQVTVKSTAENVIIQAYPAGDQAVATLPFGIVVKVSDLDGRPVTGLDLNMEQVSGPFGTIDDLSEVSSTGIYLGGFTVDSDANASGTVKLLINEDGDATDRDEEFSDVGTIPDVTVEFTATTSSRTGSVSKMCWDLTRDEITIDPDADTTIDDSIVVIATLQDSRGTPIADASGTFQLYSESSSTSTVSASDTMGGVYVFEYEPDDVTDNSTTVTRSDDLSLQFLSSLYIPLTSDEMDVKVKYLPETD